MKTLYESILDSDFMDRADKEVSIYLKREKNIRYVISVIEETITEWKMVFSYTGHYNNPPKLAVKNAVIYEFDIVNKSLEKGLDISQKAKEMFEDFESHHIRCTLEDTTNFTPDLKIVLEELGMYIQLWNSSSVKLLLCFDQRNRIAGGLMSDIANKTPRRNRKTGR